MEKTVRYEDKTTPGASSFLLFGGDEMQPQTVEKPLKESARKISQPRLSFDEGSAVAPPEGFANRETWLAAVWLNGLANVQRVNGRAIILPTAEAAEIRRWFHHRWQEVRDNREPSWLRDGLIGIGSLARIEWDEVANHYKRCPWAEIIQEAFKNAREAGLAVDRSAHTTFARRNAIADFIARPIATCRELSADEWRRVGLAIQSGELRW